MNNKITALWKKLKTDLRTIYNSYSLIYCIIYSFLTSVIVIIQKNSIKIIKLCSILLICLSRYDVTLLL